MEIDKDPNHWLDVLAGSHDSLCEVVGELDREDLRRQSYCTDWSIAQVLSHLGSGAEIFKATLDAKVAGEPPPARETFPPIWDRWNAMTPEEQAEGFVSSDGLLVETLENLGDRLDDLEFTMFGSFRVDAAGFLGMRLSEHAVHAWDVEVSLDTSATVDPDAVALLIDRLPMMAERSGKADDAPGRPFGVTVSTTDPARVFEISVGDGVGMVAREKPSKGADRQEDLRLPAEAFLRLVYGRLDPAHAPRVDEKQASTLDRLRNVFRGL